MVAAAKEQEDPSAAGDEADDGGRGGEIILEAAASLPACFAVINEDVEATCCDLYYFKHADGAAALRRILVAYARLAEVKSSRGSSQSRNSTVSPPQQTQSHPSEDQPLQPFTINPPAAYARGLSLLAAFILLTFRGTSTAAVTGADVEAESFWTFTAVATSRVGMYFFDAPSKVVVKKTEGSQALPTGAAAAASPPPHHSLAVETSDGSGTGALATLLLPTTTSLRADSSLLGLVVEKFATANTVDKVSFLP